jgi:hypothetical protein
VWKYLGIDQPYSQSGGSKTKQVQVLADTDPRRGVLGCQCSKFPRIVSPQVDECSEKTDIARKQKCMINCVGTGRGRGLRIRQFWD